MQKAISSIVLVALVACTEVEHPRITSNADIEKRISVCTSRGENLVQVPDQIGGNQKYFACAKNSWDSVPVTVYEKTDKGLEVAYVLNGEGYIIQDHGRLTIWSASQGRLK